MRVLGFLILLVISCLPHSPLYAATIEQGSALVGVSDNVQQGSVTLNAGQITIQASDNGAQALADWGLLIVKDNQEVTKLGKNNIHSATLNIDGGDYDYYLYLQADAAIGFGSLLVEIKQNSVSVFAQSFVDLDSSVRSFDLQHDVDVEGSDFLFQLTDLSLADPFNVIDPLDLLCLIVREKSVILSIDGNPPVYCLNGFTALELNDVAAGILEFQVITRSALDSNSQFEWVLTDLLDNQEIVRNTIKLAEDGLDPSAAVNSIQMLGEFDLATLDNVELTLSDLAVPHQLSDFKVAIVKGGDGIVADALSPVSTGSLSAGRYQVFLFAPETDQGLLGIQLTSSASGTVLYSDLINLGAALEVGEFTVPQAGDHRVKVKAFSNPWLQDSVNSTFYIASATSLLTVSEADFLDATLAANFTAGSHLVLVDSVPRDLVGYVRIVVEGNNGAVVDEVYATTGTQTVLQGDFDLVQDTDLNISVNDFDFPDQLETLSLVITREDEVSFLILHQGSNQSSVEQAALAAGSYHYVVLADQEADAGTVIGYNISTVDTGTPTPTPTNPDRGQNGSGSSGGGGAFSFYWLLALTVLMWLKRFNKP